MILMMLSYSVRKHVRVFQRWGRLSSWLNYHIFLGIAGSILITFHTAFKYGGLVSVAYWSMVGVALSGIIGRYIYIKIPRHVDGKELSYHEIENQQSKQREHLEIGLGILPEDLKVIDQIAGSEKIQKSGLAGIFTILTMDITTIFKQKKILEKIIKVNHLTQFQIKEYRTAIKTRIRISRQIAFWKTAQALFHYWHVIHKPFAYTMILIMVIHIITAITFGYAWLVK